MSDVFGAGQAISGGLQAAATVTAADKQADAIRHTADVAQQRYDQTRNDLIGYNTQGRSAQDQALTLANDMYQKDSDNFTGQMQNTIPGETLQDAANFLPQTQNNSLVPGGMSQAELEATPGYQFAQQQGQKAAASSAAARGLGVSGAALKGAATYATGLANQTYKDQFAIKQQQFSDQMGLDQQNFGQQNTNFNNVMNLRQGQFNQGQQRLADWRNIGDFHQQNLTNRLNLLSSFASMGENAAAQTGSTGANLSASSGSQAISGASAIGNTLTGGAGALAGTLNSYLNNQQQNNLFDKYFGGSASGGAGSSNSAFGGAGSSQYQTWGAQ